MYVFHKMSQLSLATFLLSSLCLCFLLHLLHKLWWSPRRVQKLMASQGIKGPSYRFLHGNTKDITSMKQEAMSTPMELSSHHVFSKVLPHTYSCIKLYGTTFVYWVGPEPVLAVADPELVKLILNNKDEAHTKVKPNGPMNKLMGDGLVTTHGEKWKKQRKLANHIFHADSLKGMTQDMIAAVEMMLERWTSHVGKEIEVFQEFMLLTSEVISKTAFGNSYLEGQNIFDMLVKLGLVVSRTILRVKIPVIGNIFKTSDEIEAEKLEQGVRDSIIKLIRTREERVKSGKTESYGSDFLGSLVNAYHSDDKTKKISLDDVVDECKTFYTAGHETTLALLTWVVFLLAIHPEWQDKARKEVLESFGQENPDAQGIARLPTMGMIINESLRLYGPIVNIIRRAAKEVRLGDHLIVPAGMIIDIPVFALHHNPEIWGEDAHLFKPERFAQGVAKATNNNPAAFLPFGLGPRMCVGLNFATNETKVALSMILQRYKFTLSASYVHSPLQILTLRPQHGLQIILHKV